MNASKWLSRAVVLVLCAAILPAGALALAPAQADRLDPVLRAALVDGGSSDLIVEFTVQADLSAAYSMDWEARGKYVIETLRATAQQVQAAAIAAADKQGLRHQTFLAGNELYVWGASLTAALDLAQVPNVAYLRAPGIYYVDPIIEQGPSPDATVAWGIQDTKADQFWSTFGWQGEGIVVANIDTGVQYNHPALINQYKCKSNPTSPVCWYDPSNVCRNKVCDNYGHGTHTMGTMVAADNPSLSYIAGMAPNAQWIACKGCERSSCSDSALLACADWILQPGGDTNNRPNVVNNSWGGGGGDSWYLGKVNAWRAAGIFPAFSAGNSGSNCGTLGSPGDYQESFASAAHSSSRTIASFSSRGPSAFGHTPYTKPNISAPGVYVCSTIPTNSWSCGYSGTSMASPHTAGAVALLWSCNASLVGQIDQTFRILQNNADTPPGGNCGAPGDGGNYTYGYGYLNVLAAGSAANCGAPPPPPEPTVHVSNIAMSYVKNPTDFTVTALVTIANQDGQTVSGATVNADWTLPDGSTRSQQAITAGNGVATFTYTGAKGLYKLCVTGVTASGYIYDPGQNVKTCNQIRVK